MHRKVSKEQWLAYAFLLLLALACIAGVFAPDRDIYHGATQIAGTVESSEVIQGSGLSGGTYARLHVRLDGGVEAMACTSWSGPLNKGVKVILRRGACAMDPAGNLATPVATKPVRE
jgi:hypothetical protein